MSDYRDGYVQAICEIGAIAYERAAKARYREGLAYEAGKYFGMRWPSLPKCSTTTAKNDSTRRTRNEQKC